MDNKQLAGLLRDASLDKHMQADRLDERGLFRRATARREKAAEFEAAAETLEKSAEA